MDAVIKSASPPPPRLTVNITAPRMHPADLPHHCNNAAAALPWRCWTSANAYQWLFTNLFFIFSSGPLLSASRLRHTGVDRQLYLYYT